MTPPSMTQSRSPTGSRPDPAGWVRDHADPLFRYALARVRSIEVAEDLVQETFLGALRNLDGFRRESTERTWLTGILRRKIADHFRAVSVVESVPRGGDLTRRPVRDRPCEPWTGDPARLAEDTEFWHIFRGCTERLSPPLAEVYSLREFCELPIESIAELLDITPANVSVRLFRARADLRDCLEKNWFAGDRDDPTTA